MTEPKDPSAPDETPSPRSPSDETAPGTGQSAPPPPPPPPPPGPGYGYGQPPPGTYPPTAGMAGFSVGAAFSWGWKKFRENLGPLIVVTLAIVAVLLVLAVVRTAVFAGANSSVDPATGEVRNPGLFTSGLLASGLLGLLQFVISVIISAGIINGALHIAAGRPLELSTMFRGFNVVQLVIAAIITSILTLLGFLVLIIGAVFVAYFLSFTTYYIVDEGRTAIEAIKASFNFTKDNLAELLLLFLTIIAANLVGACLCGVGLLVTIPVSILAQTYAYRSLRGQAIAA